MNRIRSILLAAAASVVCTAAVGQKSIISQEYWLDGHASGAQSVTPTIDLSDLSSGLHTYSMRVQDSEGKWSPVVTRYFIVPHTELLGTSVTERVYWLDNQVATRSSLSSSPAQISLSELKPGLHTLSVRVKDDAGVWSPLVTKYFIVPRTELSGTSVTERVYWLDNQVATRSSLSGSPAQISLSELTPGLHTLSLRVKDDVGVWSPLVTKYFIVPRTELSGTSVTEREYWLDNQVATRSSLLDSPAQISLSELKPGLHTLSVRVKDDAGVWSPLVTKYFIVPRTELSGTSVTEREYWLDNQVATRSSLSDSPAQISLSELKPGLHTLSIRVKDDAGVWSPLVTKYFIVPSVEVPATLTQYMYWFDDESSRTVGTLADSQRVVPVSIATLTEGEHVLSWCVSDAQGRWSKVMTEKFDFARIAMSNVLIFLSQETYEYAAEDILPEVLVKDGEKMLVEGEDYEIALADNHDAGVATVSVTGLGAYKESETRTFTISKALLTVTADNQTRPFGEENPELTFAYSGWKGEDDESVLLAVPIVSCVATADSPAGDYAIEVSGGEARNYDFAYENGTLTITAETVIQTIGSEENTNVWYTLDGRRLNGLPKSRGSIVVNNDRKKIYVK